MSKNYQVFVSHSWEHADVLMRLRTLLQECPNFYAEFTEAPPHDPIEAPSAPLIKQELTQRIKSSDIVLGLAGLYASYSEWMEWELKTAFDLRVPIVGVIPWGQERISQVVQKNAIETVRWNTDSIVRAIRAYARSC